MNETDYKIFKMFNKPVEHEEPVKKVNISSGEDAFLEEDFPNIPVDMEGACCELT